MNEDRIREIVREEIAKAFPNAVATRREMETLRDQFPTILSDQQKRVVAQ